VLYFKLKCIPKPVWRPGSDQTRGGNYGAPPNPLAGLRRGLLRKKMKWEGKGGEDRGKEEGHRRE